MDVRLVERIDTAAAERVACLLEAARRVARDPRVEDDLVASTGLSREGVRLGLTDYLELSPSEEELATLLAGAMPALRIHVVLSANVFTAPLRALSVACAASSHVTVKPSRREPVFASALVRAAPTLGIRLTGPEEIDAMSSGEVHVYGSDETVHALRGALPTTVHMRAHASGLGIAIVTRRAKLDEAARELAKDVIVFDQRGCLSPRVVLVEGEVARGERFVDELASHLSTFEREVPRGHLDAQERREAARYIETMNFVGTVVQGDAYAIGLASSANPLAIPPTGRHVHVATVRDMTAAKQALAPLSKRIVAVGTDHEENAQVALGEAIRARVSPLGRMQRPPFDGPVDLRAYDFGV